MRKTNIGNFKIGDEVLVTTYSPAVRATIADMYMLPFEQVPMTEPGLIQKYRGTDVPIIEVFIDGKIRSFVSEVIKKA
jgi:hypothetical protein